MSEKERWSPHEPAPGPRIPTHGELLYEFISGHTRVRCELVDHGQYGIEARILLQRGTPDVPHVCTLALHPVRDSAGGGDPLGLG